MLRVETGRRLRVGVLDGGTGFAEVRAVTAAGEVELAVEVGEAPPRVDTTPVDLIVGLPRPQALHRVLQSAAAMGVRRLCLTNAWRVEKSFFSSPGLRPQSVRRHLRLGAEQGMTTRLPEVTVERLLVPFVGRLAERSDPPLRLIAHPRAAAPIESSPRQRTVEVAVGPEGGWIEREVETFREAGFRPVRLGPWILKVENAVVAALAQIELLRRISDAGGRDNLVHRSALRTPEEP